ncbi:MAG: hypothetical protein LBK73_16525, partial [Treponema sp.]|nr:hypothetical protein [Treponema sp.]
FVFVTPRWVGVCARTSVGGGGAQLSVLFAPLSSSSALFYKPSVSSLKKICWKAATSISENEAASFTTGIMTITIPHVF